jgi:hypothetical protein
MIAPTIKWIDSGEPTSPTGAKDWYFGYGNRYADSLYVGPPALAMLAKATGDKKYLEYMDTFFWDVHDELFDQEADSSTRQRTSSTRGAATARRSSGPEAWLGHCRHSAHLRAFAQRASQLLTLRELVPRWRRAVARAQGTTAQENNPPIPVSFPNKETSGSGFFCYALAWGINNGFSTGTLICLWWKAWAGLVQCLSPEGKVTSTGGEPESVKQEDSTRVCQQERSFWPEADVEAGVRRSSYPSAPPISGPKLAILGTAGPATRRVKNSRTTRR